MEKVYKRKPLAIEALQITPHNLEEVALWCGGIVKGYNMPIHRRSIEVFSEGVAYAYVTDWIWKTLGEYDFHVMRKDVFDKNFEPYTPVKGDEGDA